MRPLRGWLEHRKAQKAQGIGSETLGIVWIGSWIGHAVQLR